MKAVKTMHSQQASNQSLNHRSSRQSLAPNRQSIAQNGMDVDPSRAGSTSGGGSTGTHRMSTSRQSIAPGGSGTAGSRSSTVNGSAVGSATPNNHRRSINGRQSLAPSAFTLPTSSMALGGSSKPTPNVDPRPLRSREFVAEMKARVHEFAELTGFSHAGYKGYATLDSPTQAIFLGLFRHIFTSAIDPNYTFSVDVKKPEEEVMTILQEYRYPGIGDITKMLLGSASSQQYWPKTLGILDWMVGLSHSAHHVPPGPLSREEKQREHLAALTRAHAAAISAVNAAPRSIAPADLQALQLRVDETSADLREAEHGGRDETTEADRAFFPFMWKCYERFWQGEDQFPDEIGRLEELFEAKNASVKKEVDRLDMEKRGLDEELKSLLDVESPLAKAESDSKLLQGDLAKFLMYRDEMLLPKVAKSKLVLERLESSRIETQAELDKLRSQHESLSAQVSSQEMSTEEFDKLSTERSNLSAEKQRLEAEIKDQENQRYDLELSNSNIQQRLEEKLKVFNPLGSRVGLFPLKVRRSHGPGDEYLDEIDLLLGQSTLLHPGLDLKHDLRNRIQELRRDVELEQRRAIEERVERQERYDEVCERLHPLKEQEDEIKGRLEVVKESIEEIQRMTDEETRTFNEDQNVKERKLNAAQQAGHKQLQSAEARLMELRAHQKHLAQLVQESLEGYKDELCVAVEECVGLKNRVGESAEEAAARMGLEVPGFGERQEQAGDDAEEDNEQENELEGAEEPSVDADMNEASMDS